MSRKVKNQISQKSQSFTSLERKCSRGTTFLLENGSEILYRPSALLLTQPVDYSLKHWLFFKIKKIDRVYSVIYIHNLISAGRNLAHKKKKTNGRCKRFHDRELPLPIYFTTWLSPNANLRTTLINSFSGLIFPIVNDEELLKFTNYTRENLLVDIDITSGDNYAFYRFDTYCLPSLIIGMKMGEKSRNNTSPNTNFWIRENKKNYSQLSHTF